MPPFAPTPEQAAILRHAHDRHARVLAGPGTGKSATLVALIEQYLGVEPRPRLRLLTFTRAATSELALKVSENPNASVERPTTIHSFAISVLLRNPGTGEFPRPLRIADDWEEATILHRSLARLCGVKRPQLRRLIREMASNWESLAPAIDPGVTAEERARFLGAWNEHRRIYGYTLLAELPNSLRMAILNHPDLKGIDFDLLVVDEYQDLNACDLEVLRLLAAKACTVIAAGDDDQSIYSFRRADPSGIRRFLSEYPGAADYTLSVTQRCGRRIIEWAGHVIAGDPSRPLGKPPLTSRPGAPEGEAAVLAFRGQTSEAQGIATIVQILVAREGVPPAEILVLLRGDHQGSFSGPIREEIAKTGISVADPDAVKRLLAIEDNRKLLEVMRLLVNREDSIAWASLLVLGGGLGDAFFRHMYDRARAENCPFGKALLRARAAGFAGAPRGTAGRARTVIEATLGWLAAHALPGAAPGGWGLWIADAADGAVVPLPTPEMRALLLSLDALAEPDQELDRFLGQITPLGKDLAASKSEGVRIMTMAGSKGLTVRATIVAGVEEGVIPRPGDDLSEERRLLFVAMTRAKEYLFLTWARRRQGPTARMGEARVIERRSPSTFLNGGPVQTEDGEAYLNARWPVR